MLLEIVRRVEGQASDYYRKESNETRSLYNWYG